MITLILEFLLFRFKILLIMKFHIFISESEAVNRITLDGITDRILLG